MTSLDSGKVLSARILFIGSLSPITDEHSLKLYFSKFGKILRTKLIVDLHTQISKQCALVFCSNKMVRDRILACKEHFIDDRHVRVDRALEEKKGTKSFVNCTLFLGNIGLDVTDNHLLAYFKRFGDVIGIKTFLVNDNTKIKNGIITFKTLESTIKVLKNAENHKLGTRFLRISKYKPKEERIEASNTNSQLNSNDQWNDNTSNLPYNLTQEFESSNEHYYDSGSPGLSITQAVYTFPSSDYFTNFESYQPLHGEYCLDNIYEEDGQGILIRDCGGRAKGESLQVCLPDYHYYINSSDEINNNYRLNRRSTVHRLYKNRSGTSGDQRNREITTLPGNSAIPGHYIMQTMPSLCYQPSSTLHSLHNDHAAPTKSDNCWGLSQVHFTPCQSKNRGRYNHARTTSIEINGALPLGHN